MSTTSSGTGTEANTATGRVTVLHPGLGPPRRPAIDPLAATATLLAAILAIAPLSSGYYSFTTWAPLGLGAIALLVVLALAVRPHLTPAAMTASAGLLLLLALSFASLLWAESRDSAWTSANQLALYAAIFAVGLLAIRRRGSAWTVLMLLGTPALLMSMALLAILIAGGGGTAFLEGRLDQPIGYINGTAGLLVMGIWPWLALAEVAASRRARVLAMAGAGLIAAMAVTTQARALVPAFALTTVLVMIAAPGRTRRGLHLAIVALAIAVSAHWTLAIYSSTGPAQQYTPPGSVLRAAGVAVLGAGLVAAGLMLGLERLVRAVADDRRERLSRQIGQAMLLLAAAAVISIGVAGHATLAAQWRDFTHLNPEQSAPNRFLAMGGGFRYDLWRVALAEFKADPLGGVGAGNYDDSYYRLRRNPQSVTVPHSLEMQMLAELGIGGIIGLLLFCGAVLRAGLAPARRTLARGDPGIRIAALGVFAAWLIETSFDWLYDIPGLTGMAMLAAAILLVRAPGETGDSAAPSGVTAAARARPGLRRSPREQAAVVGVLMVLALLAASLGRQYVAVLYRDSGQNLSSRHPVQALRQLRTAEQLDPWSLPTQYAVASVYASMNDYAAARAALLRAQQLEPENYVPPALLGDIATRAGDRRTALAAYERALRLDPREPALQEAVRRARTGRR